MDVLRQVDSKGHLAQDVDKVVVSKKTVKDLNMVIPSINLQTELINVNFPDAVTVISDTVTDTHTLGNAVLDSKQPVQTDLTAMGI